MKFIKRILLRGRHSPGPHFTVHLAPSTESKWENKYSYIVQIQLGEHLRYSFMPAVAVIKRKSQGPREV